jgi:hypothetical protein
VYKVLMGKPKERDHSEDQSVDGIRMDLREIGLGGVYWIRLAQGRDRWRAVVSAVMNLQILAPRSYNIYHRLYIACINHFVIFCSYV